MKITRDTQNLSRRLLRLCMVDGRLDDDRVRRISQAIMEGKWRSKLSLLVAFSRHVKIELARREATIQSAVPLTDDERARIIEKLEVRYGKGLTYIWEVDPSLIAGIRTKVADDVTDGSVRMRINKIRSLAFQ